GLAFATIVAFPFAAFVTLRALPRLAELRCFARFCTFDRFLLLAMIDPLVWLVLRNRASRPLTQIFALRRAGHPAFRAAASLVSDVNAERR
ncbi:MAG TPA: hypothetical protein VGU64_23430, partial [Terriglobales bacterium]|nr:hypothetical protein [Terriglobales bacterium]